MFGMMSLRYKTLQVLDQQFSYTGVIPAETTLFNEVTRDVKKNGGNEFDAAVTFMLIKIKQYEAEGLSTEGMIETIAYCSLEGKIESLKLKVNEIYASYKR